jgi:hypothetical protein
MVAVAQIHTARRPETDSKASQANTLLHLGCDSPSFDWKNRFHAKKSRSGGEKSETSPTTADNNDPIPDHSSRVRRP